MATPGSVMGGVMTAGERMDRAQSIALGRLSCWKRKGRDIMITLTDTHAKYFHLV